MAIKRLVIDGYGQLELNQVAFRRDGRIEAQCALDATDFATNPAENGMILAVDNVTRTIKLPDSTKDYPYALNYTTEHMYDDRASGLKDFKLGIKDGFYPRLGFLSVGDKYTTNCISYDTAEFADEEAFYEAVDGYATTALYGKPTANGSTLVTASAASSGVSLKVVKATTMPDGQFGLKFQVLSI